MGLCDNPKALAETITGMGGSVIPDPNVFTFTLPVGRVQEVVPKLNSLGVGCRKHHEYQSTNPITGRTENVVRLTAYYRE
jgi:hypothetical protein